MNRSRSTHSIRWVSSGTSNWEADGTFHKSTSETTQTRRGQTVIYSNITVPRSAGYWWCGVMENEELLFCSEMPIVHIFQCSCEGEPAKCPPLRDTCNGTRSGARCSPSSSDLFCLVNSVVEQTMPRSSESIFETKSMVSVTTRMPTFQSLTSETKTTIRMPTFQSFASETKTTISLTTRTSAITTPDTTPNVGDDAAISKLLPVVAPVVGTIVVVFAVVLVVIIACLFRTKGEYSGMVSIVVGL